MAENIKRDLFGSGYGDAAFQRSTANDRAVIQYQQNEQQGNDASSDTANDRSVGKTDNKLSTGMIVLIVVLCILASPVIFSVASAVLSVIAGLFATWFTLIVGFGVAAVVLIIVMLVLAVIGVMNLFSDVLIGIGILGGGLFCGALGILFLMLTVAMAGIATPAIYRGIVGLFKRLFEKKQAAQ